MSYSNRLITKGFRKIYINIWRMWRFGGMRSKELKNKRFR